MMGPSNLGKSSLPESLVPAQSWCPAQPSTCPWLCRTPQPCSGSLSKHLAYLRPDLSPPPNTTRAEDLLPKSRGDAHTACARPCHRTATPSTSHYCLAPRPASVRMVQPKDAGPKPEAEPAKPQQVENSALEEDDIFEEFSNQREILGRVCMGADLQAVLSCARSRMPPCILGAGTFLIAETGVALPRVMQGTWGGRWRPCSGHMPGSARGTTIVGPVVPRHACTLSPLPCPHVHRCRPVRVQNGRRRRATKQRRCGRQTGMTRTWQTTLLHGSRRTSTRG